MYSMIRTADRAKANELYLRITEEESTFADLASNYSEGIEQQFNGLIGPIELGRINPVIAERLRVSKEGQLWDALGPLRPSLGVPLAILGHLWGPCWSALGPGGSIWESH